MDRVPELNEASGPADGCTPNSPVLTVNFPSYPAVPLQPQFSEAKRDGRQKRKEREWPLDKSLLSHSQLHLTASGHVLISSPASPRPFLAQVQDGPGCGAWRILCPASLEESSRRAANPEYHPKAPGGSPASLLTPSLGPHPHISSLCQTPSWGPPTLEPLAKWGSGSEIA